MKIDSKTLILIYVFVDKINVFAFEFEWKKFIVHVLYESIMLFYLNRLLIVTEKMVWEKGFIFLVLTNIGRYFIMIKVKKVRKIN